MQNQARTLFEAGEQVDVVNIPFNPRNPYQKLLYGDAVRFHPRASENGLDDLEPMIAKGGPAILHLHWEDRIFGRSKDAEANRTEAEARLAQLRQFKADGGKLIWTIHNGRPHRERDPDTFDHVRAELVALADLIHVHAPHAAAHMVEEWGAQPEKMRIIRHPSYLGAYEPAETTLARPLPEAETCAFLFFGMFRAQKGLADLHTAAARLGRRREDWSLRVAGRGFQSQRRMMRHFNRVPQAHVTMDRVPDEEVPEMFGAAHAFVAPFSDFFTSGSLILALSFGLPIIGPTSPQMRQTVPRGCWDLLYEGERTSDLVRAMQRVIDMPRAELAERRQICLDYASETRAEAIGAAFQDALAEATGR